MLHTVLRHSATPADAGILGLRDVGLTRAYLYSMWSRMYEAMLTYYVEQPSRWLLIDYDSLLEPDVWHAVAGLRSPGRKRTPTSPTRRCTAGRG